MTNREALLSLAARVEAGETGREIDAFVCSYLQYGGQSYELPDGYRVIVERDPDGTPWMVGYRGETRGNRCSPPPLTTSLDAIAALTERVLPDHAIMVMQNWRNNWVVQVKPWEGSRKDVTFAYAPTEVAARLTTLLRALAEKEK